VQSIADYLANKRAEGKHYKVAISHAVKKLIRLIFALERSRQPVLQGFITLLLYLTALYYRIEMQETLIIKVHNAYFPYRKTFMSWLLPPML